MKKLFRLASLTVLTSFLVAISAAGCSSKLYLYGDGGVEAGSLNPGYPDNQLDAARGPPIAPPHELEPDGEGPCVDSTPITAADIEAQLLWQAPAPFVNVCTQQNIDDLKALFKSSGSAGVKFPDIKAALGATCAGCAFSTTTSANWQVFVEDSGGVVDNRTGSCFAQRSGNVCGKARFEWETCLAQACPDPSTSACGPGDSCSMTAEKTACKDLSDIYSKACPNEATDLTPCASVFGAIATSCSGGPTNTIDITPP